IRTARSRTSGENCFNFVMAPFSQELEPPRIPGRFSTTVVSPLSEMIANGITITADEANTPFIARGWNSPYDDSSPVTTFTTTSDVQFVRVSM
ncbi:hypothetical protein, partial [Dyella jejuensis]